MLNNQNQKGGDHSTNIQSQKMTINNFGIDERRAREICQEMYLHLKESYSQEAINTANNRIIEFENRLMPKMTRIEGALEAFADPSFQILLVEAQKTAASTERPVDYDLLSELLIHRFQKGGDRSVRAGISLAVGILDKISDEALLGLTVAHAVNSFYPLSQDINQGLDALNDLFGKMFYAQLPIGDDWIDNLDVLNLIRVNQLGSLKNLIQFYQEKLSDHIDVGILKNSENHGRASEILSSNGLPSCLLIEHSLNRDFLRVGVGRVNIDTLKLMYNVIDNGGSIVIEKNLSEEQKRAIISIYDLYSKNDILRQDNLKLFSNKWNEKCNLKNLSEWWSSIPNAFNITSVGKVLAHSNAQRCDKNLPSF